MILNRRRGSILDVYIATLVICWQYLLTSASPLYPYHGPMTVESGRNIRHLPCISRRSGQEGICMFAIDCLKANGTHLGTCIDRFYFGSCCQLEDKLLSGETEILDNSIDHNDAPTQKTEGVTLPPTLSKVTFPVKTKPSSPEIFVSPNVNQLYTTTTLRTINKFSSSSTKPWSKKPTVNISITSHITKKPEITTEVSYKLSTFQTVQSSDHNDSMLITSTEIPKATTSPITKSTVADVIVTERPTRRPINRPTTTHRTTTAHIPRPISTTVSTTHRTRPKPHRTTSKPPNRRPTSSSGSTTAVKRPQNKPTLHPVPANKPNATSSTRPSPTTGKPTDTTQPPSTLSHRPTSGVTRPPHRNHTRPTRPHKPLAPVVLLDPISQENSTSIKTTATEATIKITSTTTEPFLTTSYVETTTVKDIESSLVIDINSDLSERPDALTTTTSILTSETSTSSLTTERTESEKTTDKISTPTTRPPIFGDYDFITTQKMGLVTWTNVNEESVTLVPTNDTKDEWTPVTTPDGWVLIPSVSPSTTASSSTTNSESLDITTSRLSTAHPQESSIPGETSTNEISTTEKPLVPVEISTTAPANNNSSTTSATSVIPTSNGNYPSVNMSDFRDVCGRRLYPEARIVGGAKATFGKWPWQISLRQWRTSTYLHKCGAALLNENWAITAAHCVDNVPPSDLLLRLGEHDLSIEEEPYGYQERRVQIVASHPQFDPRTFEYDLALLRFYEPVNFQPNILPVCVPHNDEGFVGKTAYVTGWGRLYEDGPLPSILQEVSVPVINNSVCETMYRSAGYIEHIPNIFICAGWRKGGYDSCEGDSGGPMVIQRPDRRFLLAGIISWGIGCAEPNQPGVYTRISEFRDWINQILQF